MNILIVVRIISFVIFVIGCFMTVPTAIAYMRDEKEALEGFMTALLVLFSFSGILLFTLRNRRARMLSTRDGFLFVTFAWVAASLFGAIPFYASGAIPAFTDAFFETISGFSTTGASILTNIEGLPSSILFWRSLTHWLGGMGIVVLTVAILPLLGIGGLQLIQAEAPGPTVDKISPRITETAKKLWLIYIGMTIAQTVLLMFGGLNIFDALTHTFGTLATGGFSTRNSSVGTYNSAYIDAVVTFFMVMAGVSFTLHYRFLTGNITPILKDIELRSYLSIFAIATLALAGTLYLSTYNSFLTALRYAGFQAASILTTTGYATADYERWPFLAQTILFILMFIGGCSGSTGGGIKVIRLVILLKQALNEMKHLIHPRGIFTLRLGKFTVKKEIAYAVSGFFFLYIAMVMTVTFIVALSGHDILTSVTTALATVGNIGPGFGLVGPAENYAFFSAPVKWVLSFAMLAGRLELYTVLILFTRTFWKK